MPRHVAAIFIALVMLCVASARGSAQSATNHDARTDALMVPGARVRVKLPGARAWTGTLVSVADDSMLVHGKAGADPTLVRLSQVTRLEVSAGRRRSPHRIRNTLIGVGIGSGLGWVIGTALGDGGCSRYDPCWLSSEAMLAAPVKEYEVQGTVIGGLAGGALGVLVSRARTEDWQPVSLGPRRTAVRLSRRGASVSIAF